MIAVTRLNNRPMVVNAELIKFVESTPDTMITMTTGDRVLVRESLAEVVDLAIQYGRRVRCFSPGEACEGET
ncbi:MAG: flagellar FlbD family protein [Planctomycetota bacterium]